MTEFFDVEIQTGETVSMGEYNLTPFAQVIKITPPGMSGGFIWNRPVSVLVQTPDGSEGVLAVPDVTRQAIYKIIGMGILAVIVTWLVKQVFKQ